MDEPDPDPDPDPLRCFLVPPPPTPNSPRSAPPHPSHRLRVPDPEPASPDLPLEGSLVPAHGVATEIEADKVGVASLKEGVASPGPVPPGRPPEAPLLPVPAADQLSPRVPGADAEIEADKRGAVSPQPKPSRLESVPADAQSPFNATQEQPSTSTPASAQQLPLNLIQDPPPTQTTAVPASPTAIDQELQKEMWAILPDLARDLKNREQQRVELTRSNEGPHIDPLKPNFRDQQGTKSSHSMERLPEEGTVDEALFRSSMFSANQKGKQVQSNNIHGKAQHTRASYTATQSTTSSRLGAVEQQMPFPISVEGGEPAKATCKLREKQMQVSAIKPSNLPISKPTGFEFFKSKLEGRCYNCFSPNHIARDCNAKYRCWKCLLSGHRAADCNPGRKHTQYKDRELHKTNTTAYSFTKALPAQTSCPKLTGLSYAEVVHGSTSMVAARYPGDPRARPVRGYCAVAATGPIRRRRDDLINRAAVCWLHSSSHDTEPHHLGEALRGRLHLCHDDFQILKHYPEQFLIIFREPADRERLLDRGAIYDGGRDFNFAPWSERRNAVNVTWEFRVKVRVEGIPPHCWAEEVAAKAIGRSCAVHYLEEKTRRRECTRTFDLWAWCSNPTDIPKEVILTVTEPDREPPPTSIPFLQAQQHRDDPVDLKRGHDYILRNHLEWVEDLSFLQGRTRQGGPGNRKPSREFIWSYGVPDSVGERLPGRRDEDRGRDMGRYHRRDDDGHDRDHRSHGTRRHRSLSGWARNSRCRGAMEDCASSNRWRGGRGSPPPRSRAPAAVRQVWKVKGSKSKIKKKVTFADPIATELKPTKSRLRDDSIMLIKESDSVPADMGKAQATVLNNTDKGAVVSSFGSGSTNYTETKMSFFIAGDKEIAHKMGNMVQIKNDKAFGDNTANEPKTVSKDSAMEEVPNQGQEGPDNGIYNNDKMASKDSEMEEESNLGQEGADTDTGNGNIDTVETALPKEMQLAVTESLKMLNKELRKDSNEKHPVEMTKMAAIHVLIEEERKKRTNVGNRQTMAQVTMEA